MAETRTCHICGTVTAEWCPTCVTSFEKRRDADGMTPDERVAEFDSLCGPLEIPFSMLHQRIGELAGRAIWTHELGSSSIPRIREEIRARRCPTAEEWLAPFEGKTVILVDPDA